MDPLRDHLVSALKWARECTYMVMKDWPEDKATYQATEADNHLIWTLGHLAVSDEWVRNMLTGEPNRLPEEFRSGFGYQSTVSPSPGDYPPLDEVRIQFEQARQWLLGWLEGVDDATLQAEFEGGGEFARTAEDAIQKEVWHEGWHTGQLATLRRALELKPAFGEGD